MAPTLKGKGIAISNKPPTKRQKVTSKRGKLRIPNTAQALPPGHQDDEWPVKRILREGKTKYLVLKTDVGTAAKEEWWEEKQQKQIRFAERSSSPQNEHFATSRLRSRRGPAYAAERDTSPETSRAEQDNSRISRQRYSKKRFIPSSSPPPEIPETQQAASVDRGAISVNVYRPADFDSQDWSTLRSSQLVSVVATQDTASSKDTGEVDSTLGSSLPPDSPTQAGRPSSALPAENSSELVAQRYLQSASERPRNSGLSAPLYDQSISSSIDGLLCLRQDAHSDQPNLLVVRSTSLGETSVGTSHSAELQAEHASISPVSSALFVTDEEDLDLRPITEPGRSREESLTEGEIDFLPIVSSAIESSNLEGAQLRPSDSEQRSATRVAPAEQPENRISSSPRIVSGNYSGSKQKEAQQLLKTPIRTVLVTPIRSPDIKSIESPASTTSGPLHLQISLQEASERQTESLEANPRIKTARISGLTISHRSPRGAQSLPPSTSQPTSTAAPTSKSISPLVNRTSPRHKSLLTGASIPTSREYKMPNSHHETSSRVRRPPSGPPEATPELGFREKLRQIRAASRANQEARSKSQATIGSSKSPATKTLETRFSRRLSPEKNTGAPATVPTPTQDQPIPSLENIDGSAREMELEKADDGRDPSSSLPPPPPISNATLRRSMVPNQVEDVDAVVPELDIPTMPLLQPAEFVVPLPIDGRIKHQYVAELTERYKDIADFLNSPKSPRLIDAMNHMIGQLNDTVIHTDLGMNGPATQLGASPQEALWAEDASSKFAFLGEMIHTLHGSKRHVVLTAGNGLKLDLLHNYLKGKGVYCRRYLEDGTVERSDTIHSADGMMYTLISTRNGVFKQLPRSASLIVAFDDSLDAAMLPEWCSTDQFVPVLLLLVVNSAEHVGRCISKDLSEPERLRRLVKATVHVYKQLGEMPFHLDFRHAFNLDPGNRLALVKKDLGAKIKHAAVKTVEAMLSNSFALNFTLQPISEPDLTGLQDCPPSMEESKGVSSSGSRAGTPGGQKRLRDEHSSSALQSKRQRLTPLQDITHITDSAKNSQSEVEELKTAVKKAQQEASEERKARLKAEKIAANTRSRLREISESLGDVQHRYETRMKQVHRLEQEKQKTIQEKEADTQRREKVIAENLALKDERSQLQEELRTARDALKSSSIPAIADLETARESAREATREAAALLKSNTSLRKDFEFTRAAYQDASTKAAEYAAEVTDLELQTTELKRQASDERRRLAETNSREDRKRDLARIAELELERANCEAVLRRVEEENKALRKGRGGVATRGSSVQPGGASPRTALGQPPGSRGGSPAAAALGGMGGGGGGLVGGRASALRNER